ncbi:MAG: helix-turn-helix domain-containing protein [Roseburia sp.]|nr:helix-turn-helix domain-containing protein [Roseburia sp.]
MKDELTLNMQLSPLALKLRTLRLNKSLTIETLSALTKIAQTDIIAFETDRAKPNEQELKTLLEILSK